jgi:hypothetical protein
LGGGSFLGGFLLSGGGVIGGFFFSESMRGSDDMPAFLLCANVGRFSHIKPITFANLFLELSVRLVSVTPMPSSVRY